MNQLNNREIFDRLFQELKSRNEELRQHAGDELRIALENAQREYVNSPAEYTATYQHVVNRSSSLANTPGEGPERTVERIGGIYALMSLMQFKGDDAARKTTRFATVLRNVMKGTDTTAMIYAARALGKLAQPQNPLCSELVDAEVKVALESLQVDRQEPRRFAAVLILRELADNSPTLLYQYVNAILELIWVALRDPKVLIRESAAEAVSAIFEIIAARDMQLRDQWFARVHNEIVKGFQMNSIETTHGSLLALKELLTKGGMFMQGGTRYADACDKVFSLKDHRDPLIRKQVTIIIPILAFYYPQEFSSAYLHKFMMYLQGILKQNRERDQAFIAIGKVASAVGSAIEPYLDGILVYVREGLGMKARNKAINDAPIFECISMIAIAVGQTLTKYMDALLDPIFACGLSEPLAQALVDMAHYIPPARPTIQEKLLDLLSRVLSGRPFSPLGAPNQNAISANMTRDQRDPAQNEQKEAEIKLALQTLGSFDFSGYILNEFVRDVAIRYVEDESQAIRKAAALTCCQLFIKDPSVKQVSRHAVQVVSAVIERLLAVAVADPAPDIRHVVLTSLVPRFDKHLAKAENIRSLFLALNDEYFANREAAMTIIGRLTAVNPAYVFPSLRKALVQLLTEIEYSGSPRAKQESAKLISHLVASSSRLIKPYVDPIVAVLLPKTRDADETVAATSLKAIGDLAVVGGEDMIKYIDTLMKTIMLYLSDQSSSQKRSAALKTLGQLGSNAGYVIDPYIDHPELLNILMTIIQQEQPGPARRETIRVMGILGALAPYRYQMLVEESPEHNLANEAKGVSDVSLIINGQRPDHEDYYPTIVIYTLMDLLHDPSLSQYHSNVIEAVMNIYATMGLKCVNFLNKVIPGFILVINSATPAQAEGYFNQLSQLVRIVRQHIRPFLHPILDTVQSFWTDRREALATMLTLIESIARSLEGDFKVYLARVLPLMLDILREDKSARRAPSERILRAFLVFGSSAEEYMHLIIPQVVRIFDRSINPSHIRKQAMETIGRISRKVNISEFATRLVHPLCRVLASNAEPQLKSTALETLCALIFQLGPDYTSFIPMVNKVLSTNRIPHNNYTIIVNKLQKGEPLPQNLSPEEHYGDDEDENRPAEISTKQLAVNQEHLKSAWETSQRSTKEDWLEWIKRLSIELLKESPQQALRACAPLASVHAPTSRALFNSAFASCYTLLFQNFQRDLVANIEGALSATHIPAEILQQLLNLCEFMEHDDKALPIDVRTLGGCAGRCHAFAKALHWKELEYNADQSPSAVDALIHINNNLQQYDAAFGILKRAHQYSEVDVQENWYEKLGKFEEALQAFQRREQEEPYSFEVTFGKMRCLHALGEWDVLASLAEDRWSRAAAEGRQKQIAPLAAAAAWGLKQWELVDKYMSAMRSDSPDRSFFGAILSIHRNQFDDAKLHIESARDVLDTELTAGLGESYNRAYNVVVRIQMLAELEEIITYKQNGGNPDKQGLMRQTWIKRLKGCQRHVETWQRMLKVRALVIKPSENQEMLIKFANLCRKSSRWGLAEKTLKSLVTDEDESDDNGLSVNHAIAPAVNYARLKFCWARGEQETSLASLQGFTQHLGHELSVKSRERNANTTEQYARGVNGISGSHSGLNGTSFVNGYENGSAESKDLVSPKQLAEWQKLLARCHLKQGQWQMVLAKGDWRGDHVQEVLSSYAAATHLDPKWHKAWHAWALGNFEVISSMTAGTDRESAELSSQTIVARVVPAIRGFFKSIALTATSTLQDTLRILTLWFAHGSHSEVNSAITEGISTISVNTWLEVIPQLIARINQQSPRVRQLVHNLLCEVGKAHPQALVYPLTVAIKSEITNRSRSALSIMENLRQHSPRLVEQAELVSRELIRIAVLWHEQWHEGLEEASRLYFGEKNVSGMFGVLEPLHDMIDRGPQTLREVSFIQTFGRDLHEAREFCNAFKRTQDDGDLNSAWDVYYQVFRKIAKQNAQIQNLELTYVSPELKEARNLELAVPGTYQAGKTVIRIESFESTAQVIQSKQRPRRFCMRGSDGNVHTFLLKGHEDIRQDERVMQLFGLVNTLLQNDTESVKRHLSIQRYSAIPLSTNSGLLGWVPNSDTLHMLIREYREQRNILLNIEHRIMLQMAPDFEMLSLMQKVEVFSYAMDNTTGQDLYRVLWLKSKSSEAWLDRRTNYIRSLGVMSMVGYILGLGDRHPSNLMLDKVTGKIVHIDFGDCFEVAMHRDKYPERVPFRLTRMLTFAMEVSNIEGSFRTTCEAVMRVMRENKESLMAVLEAFVHDPLLTWRLNTRSSPPEPSFRSERRESIMGVGAPDAGVNADRIPHPAMTGSLSGRPPGRHRSSTTGTRPTGLGSAATAVNGNSAIAPGAGGATFEGKGTEQQNQRALQVLARVKEKLTGRDFIKTVLAPDGVTTEQVELGVDEQVERLIREATNLENLCQHYIGWCSFW